MQLFTKLKAMSITFSEQLLQLCNQTNIAFIIEIIYRNAWNMFNHISTQIFLFSVYLNVKGLVDDNIQ